MADIISHLTSSNNILMYIDSVEKKLSKYNIEGWIFATNGKITNIKLKGSAPSDLTPEFSNRPDVIDFYKEIKDSSIGFGMTIGKLEAFTNIIVSVLDNDTNEIIDYEIESFAKWIAYYSGFKNTDKGVIVVDNFYKDPDFIREWAINEIKFSPSEYHKGERAISRFSAFNTKETLEQIIGKPIYNWNHSSYANGIFQFCTADQPIVYHVDNQTYAGLVFLTPDAPASTGTAFYRSKVTGDYSFDDAKRKTMNYVRAFQGKSAEMNFYDGTNFEKIDEVGNVYNRLVLFDAKNIHAATQYFGDAIDNARFFHMFFFDV
jgi:hypothetical protein